MENSSGSGTNYSGTGITNSDPKLILKKTRNKSFRMHNTLPWRTSASSGTCRPASPPAPSSGWPPGSTPPRLKRWRKTLVIVSKNQQGCRSGDWNQCLSQWTRIDLARLYPGSNRNDIYPTKFVHTDPDSQLFKNYNLPPYYLQYFQDNFYFPFKIVKIEKKSEYTTFCLLENMDPDWNLCGPETNVVDP